MPWHRVIGAARAADRLPRSDRARRSLLWWAFAMMVLCGLNKSESPLTPGLRTDSGLGKSPRGARDAGLPWIRLKLRVMMDGLSQHEEVPVSEPNRHA